MNLSLLQIEREMAERGRMEPIDAIQSAIKDCTDIGLPRHIIMGYIRFCFKLTERQAETIINKTTGQ